MPPRKKDPLSAIADTSKAGAKAAEDKATEPRHEIGRDRIPPLVRFLMVIAINVALSSALFTFASDITLGELGSVSKPLDTWADVGGLLAWKAVETGVAWILGCDDQDVLSFVFLTHLPTYFFLSSFYNLRPTTILTSYAIAFSSTVIPFILHRKNTSVHNLFRSQPSTASNRAILQDYAITTYTTVLAAAIYTVTLYLSYETWLPAKLVVHFDRLPNITKVHAGPAGLPTLFATLLPAGLTARNFLFVSSTGTPSRRTEKKASSDSQEGEYLIYTVYRKTWGVLSPKARVLISRTAVLAAMLVANTTVQIAGTIKGADIEGAAYWGSVWAGATVIVGMTYGWIEAVDGV